MSKTKTKTKKQIKKTSDKRAKTVVVKSDTKKRYLTTAKATRIKHKRYLRLYAGGALLLLVTTTVLWALLGGHIHQSNTDQLVNTYLFERWDTFRHASFPVAHSYLIKWPFFLIIKLLGPSHATFIGMTVLISLATVLGFAYILYRIDRRPVVFGTLWLALASVLLLVPPQPYPGGLLPVNFAMIATRNLEYLVYIACLALIVTTKKLRSRKFWLAVVGLGLLAASDKLFLTFSLGGAVMALAAYVLRGRKPLTRLSLRWLGASLAALVMAYAVIWLINVTHLTHITGQYDSSPYALTHSLRTLGVGVVFMVLAVMTNFGANPAFDATLIRTWPQLAIERLTGLSAISLIVNMCILGFGIYAAIRILLGSLLGPSKKKTVAANSSPLALMLVWSAGIAMAVYVLTNHDYVVDARYLTLTLFTGFVAAAATVSQWLITPKLEKKYMVIGLVCSVSIFFGIFSTFRTYRADTQALTDTNARNNLALQSLRYHSVDVLVGDYWRVIPIKAEATSPLRVMPLEDCIHARGILDSKSWQPDLSSHSFAYLLSFDKGLTNYPTCSLEQITDAYGKPNQSVLLVGSVTAPKEVLLYYDRGAHKSAPTTPLSKPSSNTVLPLSLEQLPNTNCTAGPTTVNVVAHQDDDLLFMNPDILHDIHEGKCVRTIYVTAGDDGAGEHYWQARESGSEAAYSTMIGASNIWIHRTVRLASGAFVTIANPRGNPRVSLVFLRLPDGNLSGQGFRSSSYESLQRLDYGHNERVTSVDGQSAYDAGELTDSLLALIRAYQPTVIRTQAYYNASAHFPDHSDHVEVGRFTQRAFNLYQSQATIKYYLGYPIRESDVNVTGNDLDQKETAFFAYAQFDSAVCSTVEICQTIPTYGSYIPRQYTIE